ncbi:uncharacterized protein LDX57_010706 [Aspergillus melleus]|uniref:uncharacterized protein n=1 Tax=Aspergillus melleus TaxID=138277 RepID=UPI001E8CB73F|nr:uncharacterized protein LDX57_010706 [Aspergillus melleus]KAH8433069.1 hypothetical protein LDX57_010706 [Aspergillus melleus]
MHLRDLCNNLMPILLRRHRDSQNKTFPESSHLHHPPSLNNILVAVLGLCVERARAKNGLILPKSSGVSMIVNLRRHFQPPLPDHYIGNAVRVARVIYHRSGDDLCADSEIDTDSLAGLPSSLDKQELLYLANVAFRISAVAKSTSDEHIQGLFSNLNDRINGNDTPDQGPDLWVSSWRHLSVYELDFGPGMGKIDSFESPPGMVDGACVILPASKESRGNNEPAP